MAGNIPYIGSKISLITTSDIRYEGILYTLNREESTIAVQNVRSFGTEGRRIPEVPMSNEIYDFIIFRGKDLKDLTVLQGAPDRQPEVGFGGYMDPTMCAPYPAPHQAQQGAYAAGHSGYYPAPDRQPEAGHAGYYGQPVQQTPAMPQLPQAPQQQLQQGAPTLPQTQQVPYLAQGSGRGPAPVAEEGPGSAQGDDGMRRAEDRAAKGRGKGASQRKPLLEVLRLHKRAEEAISKARAFGPAELRTMSEGNPAVYHFYLDFLNYCCPSHGSDEQQWDMLSKALKKHFERDSAVVIGTQNSKPLQPQRPNNTLGDFITIEAAGKAKKGGAKAPRGAAPAPSGGRGRGGRGQGAGDLDEDCTGGGPWVCTRCTLRNEDLLVECAACGTSRQHAAILSEFPALG